MDAVTAVPVFWKTSGSHGRLTGLSTPKTITLAQGQFGVYVQTRGQNVYVTLDGSTPVVGGNDVGFEIRTTDAPVLLPGEPGTVFTFLQVAATAVIQYQILGLVGR